MEEDPRGGADVTRARHGGKERVTPFGERSRLPCVPEAGNPNTQSFHENDIDVTTTTAYLTTDVPL